MLRKNLKLALCTFLTFSLMTLVACGNTGGTGSALDQTRGAEPTSAEESKTAKSEAPEAKASESEAAQSDGKTSSGKYATVADFAKSDEVQNELEAQKKSLEGTGTDVTITGEDNKLVYTFIYSGAANLEDMTEALERGLEGQKSIFVSVAKYIKLAVEVDDPIVVVQYLTSDGKLIYSAEFTADTPTDQSDSTAISGRFATVADFAKSDLVQNELEIQKKSLEGTGMDITITGEDNKLIYTFIWLEIENPEGMAEALEQQMQLQKSTMVSVAKSLKLAVDVDDAIVVVRYIDANGEEIYSAEFTADME